MSESKTIKQKVTGKIILSATLKSITPFLIGKGTGEETDVDALLQDDTPYIPASSLAGSIHSRFDKIFDSGSIDNNQLEYFWGTHSGKSDNKNTSQSHITFQDLIPAGEAKVVVRDGVKIESGTGIAKSGAKYDYQCVEPGLSFPFNAEITIREGFEEKYFQQFAKAIQEILEKDFRVGAHTTTGFGRLECQDFKVYQFNFPDQAAEWFQYLQNGALPESSDFKNLPELPKKESKTFHIKADFNVKSTLMVGSFGVDPQEADKKHLQSNDTPVLPGKSIKGALRHRALKILNTLEINNAEEKLKYWMGWVDTDYQNESARKSRLWVTETYMKGVKHHLQNRIKIDRFTGGAMSGALFDSEPVWRKDATSFTIEFAIEEYSNWEAGLLLLLLKDLWHEDLPIGGEKNIGRGVLKGISAEFNIDDKPSIFLKNGDNSGLSDDEQKLLESYVQALNHLEKETKTA